MRRQRYAANKQAIEFKATDLPQVTNGEVTDNLHIEDDLTVLQQMRLVPMQ